MLDTIDWSQPSRTDIKRLLMAEGELQQQLFRLARETRAAAGVDDVTIRGVVEITNFCQKRCDYCSMRANNRELDRYRLEAKEILDIVAEIKACNIGVAFLQGGQDPADDGILEEVIPVIKRDFDMEVLLCVGERPREKYLRWAELGADSFILKFELSDPVLHKQVIHASLDRRARCMQYIREAGMRLGTGNIVGMPGQTIDHLIDDILYAADIRPDFVSTSPFIPNEQTPYENDCSGNMNMTLNTMAIWRIMLRTPLIPTVSALEKIQADGQLAGLNAGANILTINFTPQRERSLFSIYSNKRFIVSYDHAMQTIERAGLRPKPVEDIVAPTRRPKSELALSRGGCPT